jgi:hypothetical protein
MNFWTTVNNSSFILPEIPNLHPIADRYEYRDFWKQEKKQMIEGAWESGKWIPGPLYYYINFHNILVEDPRTLAQKPGKPWLRDIDWELFLLYEECRGFSGFYDDHHYTCNRFLGPDREAIEAMGMLPQYISLGVIREEDLYKEYIPARHYLRTIHKSNLGKPLYQNSAKNLISIQARGGGKSYASAGIGAHNWLTGGAIDYDEYLIAKRNKKPLTSDTVIGAIDSKWSAPLLDKIIFGLNNLPGEFEYENSIFPSPLYKSWSGSKKEGSFLKNVDGSYLYHRTFHNNPLAGNAGRPNLVMLDEIGFFDILVETIGALEGAEASKMFKRQVIWMLGTGGFTQGGSVLYAENVFRNPEQYNCLAFDDTFEQRGKIGYFVPVTSTRNKHKKGPNLITDTTSAMMEEDLLRESRKKDLTRYQVHIINNPIVPSEAFLVTEGTRFPTVLLKDQLSEVLGGKKKRFLDASYKGWLKFNDKQEVYFETVQDKLPIRSYPLDQSEDKRGLVEVFQKPKADENGNIETHRYIAGIDVVDKAKATTSSLPSIIVFDRLTRTVVAEYTGRTDDPKFFYEVCRRLLLFYKATGMYEQNFIGLFNYFVQNNCTYLLADTPYQLRNSDTYKAGTNTSKGIYNSGRVNDTGIDYINSWLMSTISMSNDDLMLTTVLSPAILKELIRWNPKGNFDRISALIMLFWYDETMHKVKKETNEKKTTFLESSYFARRGVSPRKQSFFD